MMMSLLVFCNLISPIAFCLLEMSVRYFFLGFSKADTTAAPSTLIFVNQKATMIVFSSRINTTVSLRVYVCGSDRAVGWS